MNGINATSMVCKQTLLRFSYDYRNFIPKRSTEIIRPSFLLIDEKTWAPEMWTDLTKVTEPHSAEASLEFAYPVFQSGPASSLKAWEIYQMGKWWATLSQITLNLKSCFLFTSLADCLFTKNAEVISSSSLDLWHVNWWFCTTFTFPRNNI